MTRRLLVALTVLAAGAVAYLVAVELAFRWLGSAGEDDEPGGGWQS